MMMICLSHTSLMERVLQTRWVDVSSSEWVAGKMKALESLESEVFSASRRSRSERTL